MSDGVDEATQFYVIFKCSGIKVFFFRLNEVSPFRQYSMDGYNFLIEFAAFFLE